MNKYQKIIITVTTANSLVYPEVKNWAQTDEKLIEDVAECCEAGAVADPSEARKILGLKSN